MQQQGDSVHCSWSNELALSVSCSQRTGQRLEYHIGSRRLGNPGSPPLSDPYGDSDGVNGLAALDWLCEPYAIAEIEIERCLGRLSE